MIVRGLKRAGKRFLRDMLGYGSIWLVVVVFLGIYFSGAVKIEFLDQWLKEDNNAVSRMAGAVSESLDIYQQKTQQSSQDFIDDQGLILQKDTASVLAEIPVSQVEVSDINAVVTELTPEPTEETTYYYYENGEYLPYPRSASATPQPQ